jgi:hypothetical protein
MGGEIVTKMTTIVPGMQIGHWLALAMNGRRVACRCRCGVVREVSVDALASGAITSCGCMPPNASQNAAAREAKAEQERRRTLRDWKPEGRS